MRQYAISCRLLDEMILSDVVALESTVALDECSEKTWIQSLDVANVTLMCLNIQDISTRPSTNRGSISSA